MSMKTFAITTLGCKANQSDSKEMEVALNCLNLRSSDLPASPDIHIINTCTVTHRVDFQSRQLIRRLKKINPSAKVIVTGCYAQVSPEEVSKIPGVDHVIGNAGKKDIVSLIRNIIKDSPQPNTEFIRHPVPVLKVSDDLKGRHRTREFLKIQDGCESFCSYCIVPYARGAYRSLEPGMVIDALSKLSEEGYREVVLTGIHLGMYGNDLHAGVNILSLLRQIEREYKDLRIRISSIEPGELTDDMIDLFAESSVVCNHLHIPLQSGDDGILKAMNRRYSSSFFASVIEKAAGRIKDVGIGIDLIAGFPGEGEGEFLNTLNLLNGLPISYLHVFPYSKRKGTPAAGYPGQVLEEVKKERCEQLRQLSDQKKTAFIKSFINKKTLALIERKKDRASNVLKGITRNYMHLSISSTQDMVNEEVTVRIKDAKGNADICEE